MVANCKHAYIHIVYIYIYIEILYMCVFVSLCFIVFLSFPGVLTSTILISINWFSVFSDACVRLLLGIHKCPVRVEVRAMTITANTPWSKRIESSSHAHQPVSSFQTTPGIFERTFRGFDCSTPVTQDKKTIKGCATKFENRFLRTLTHTC